ncbi:hypothetical protein [Brevundimonas sp.]|uniref:hypothetical protein n=1 Tax=Brevundimonas sp. TaxID=1871086 RepID=UPI00391C21B2
MPVSIRRLAFVSFVAGCLAQPVLAQDEGGVAPYGVRDRVRTLAFDPTRFFPSEHIEDRSTVRIVYTGDDYDWPVYAIAVAEGCVDAENIREDDCASRLRARMVRAPAPADLTRPRQRGTHLVGRLIERGATSPRQIQTALDEIGVEWVEADLRACPEALAALGRSANAVWVPDAVANPVAGDELMALVLHADIVQVEVEQFARVSTYRGWIDDGSPAAWATDFAGSLESCWAPAGVPAPWSRGG